MEITPILPFGPSSLKIKFDPPGIGRSWNGAFWLIYVAMLKRCNIDNVHTMFKIKRSRMTHIQPQQNVNLVTSALQRENNVL